MIYMRRVIPIQPIRQVFDGTTDGEYITKS